MYLPCLNTSTIRPASLMVKIEAAADAGFKAVELWNPDVFAYLEEGGTLEQVQDRLAWRGLVVPSMIAIMGFVGNEEPGREERAAEARRRLRDDLLPPWVREELEALRPQGEGLVSRIRFHESEIARLTVAIPEDRDVGDLGGGTVEGIQRLREKVANLNARRLEALAIATAARDKMQRELDAHVAHCEALRNSYIGPAT